ncbi:MAG: hypothetical protein R6X02_11710 [Enhygromyxa sp.]
MRRRRALSLAVALGLLGPGLWACRSEQPSPTKVESDQHSRQPKTKPEPEPKPPSEAAEEPKDALSGEAAHVIPFADRTSMGYLLLLPPGTRQPEPPTRERLQTLVEQAFPDRRRDGEIDLLLKLIATEPHATDLRSPGELLPPSVDEAGVDEAGEDGSAKPAAPVSPEEVEALVAKRERERIFDLIGLHIEVVHIGIGDDATIPSAAFDDPILTRGLSEEQRKTALGRSWALLLRADYRNQHAVRGLRLHQTLVRVVAEHYDALIHDPDTLETMSVESFTQRRLRAAAGNVADQIAIVPFVDRRDDKHLRLATRGMRRFGAVDLELDGLPRDEKLLQQASDLIAGLALAMVKEGEVDPSGFAVEVPQVIEVDTELIRQSYATRDYQPPLCKDCPGVVELHLVERPPEDHDPQGHVVARIVAPREQSDASDYDHPQWVRAILARLF